MDVKITSNSKIMSWMHEGCELIHDLSREPEPPYQSKDPTRRLHGGILHLNPF